MDQPFYVPTNSNTLTIYSVKMDYRFDSLSGSKIHGFTDTLFLLHINAHFSGNLDTQF